MQTIHGIGEKENGRCSWKELKMFEYKIDNLYLKILNKVYMKNDLKYNILRFGVVLNDIRNNGFGFNYDVRI
jgi:hypothetical protein